MIPASHIVIAFGIVISVAVAGWAYADHLQGRVEQVTRERDFAISERDAAERALIVMADEAKASEARSTIRATGREAILALPVAEDGPVSGVLRRGMSVADEIGGVP